MKNILVVDDNTVNLKLLSLIIAQEGYDVSIAKDASMAFDIINQKTPDLILLDINMPDINGYEMCSKIKENPSTKDIPVIFVSALSDVEDKMKALNAGGVGYITKPFNADEVKMQIATWIN